MKNLVKVTALAVAANLLLAVSASSAMAEEVVANFSASTVKLSTPNGLTVKKNGGEATTCSLAAPVTGSAFSNFMYVANTEIYTELNCPSSQHLTLGFYPARASYDTVSGSYKLILEYAQNGIYKSPWGNYRAYGFGNPVTGWTNGSGSTQSTINFNETEVGRLYSTEAKITVSGTVTATTSTGTLLTLSH